MTLRPAHDDTTAMMSRGRDAALSRVGFGCARIGSFNNPMSNRDAEHLLERAVELGITVFDTADIYGQGDSERTVGRVLRRHRGSTFVVTKVGQTFSPAMRIIRPLKPLLKPLIRQSGKARAGISGQRTSRMGTDFSPAYVSRAIDHSLRRLGVDTIDALLLHSPAANELMIPALDHVLTASRRAGKIRHYGMACDDVECVEAALRLPNLGYIEVPPPVLRDAAAAIGAAVATRGLQVLVREVIRFRGTLLPRTAVAAMTMRPDVASVIVGTTSMVHLEDLVRSSDSPASWSLSDGADRPVVPAQRHRPA